MTVVVLQSDNALLVGSINKQLALLICKEAAAGELEVSHDRVLPGSAPVDSPALPRAHRRRMLTYLDAYESRD